jgi:hypothetical protein
MNNRPEAVNIVFLGENFFRRADGVVYTGAESTLIGNYDFHKITD